MSLEEWVSTLRRWIYTRRKKFLPANPLGQAGEEAAAAFLRQKSFRILERNKLLPSGEIDLIVQHGPWLIFVEVKTRRFKEGQPPPEMSVTAKKRRKLRRLAREYLWEQKMPEAPYRFDIIAIQERDGKFEIQHFESAF